MKAYQIVRPATAFSLSPGKKKRPRERREDHLDFVRGCPCLVCGSRVRVHAAHLRASYVALGKRDTGKAEKPDDAWTVPLCAEHHTDGPDAQHKGDELAFWDRHKINPFLVALALFRASGDEEAAEIIIREARPK